MKTEKQPRLSFKPLPTLQEVDSTYLLLERMLVNNPQLPSGTLLNARYQTAGRGQLGNSWFASRGQNILLSFLLRGTGLPANRSLLLSHWVAFSVAQVVAFYLEGLRPEEYIETEHSHIALKWPNDIVVDGKKIAGMLVKNQWQGGEIQTTRCGIGLNVNETCFPPELPLATSLKKLCQKEFVVDEVLSRLVHRLESNYPLLFDPSPIRQSQLHRYYQARLFQKGVPADYVEVASGIQFRGVIEGVTDDGRLRVYNQTLAKIFLYAFKEIVYLLS